MTKLIISPSKLEQFRCYYDEEYNGKIQIEDIISYLKGEVEWKKEMNYGSAIHAVLEFGHEKYLQPDGQTCLIKEDEFPEPISIPLATLQPVLDYRLKYPKVIHEVKVRKLIEVSGYQVLLNMRVDGMFGLGIHEHKNPQDKGFTTYESYEKSSQWKVYLYATGANFVQYNIFKWKETKRRGFEIIPETYTYYRFPTMEWEVISLVQHLINFCERQGLIHLLESKFDK